MRGVSEWFLARNAGAGPDEGRTKVPIQKMLSARSAQGDFSTLVQVVASM
jgi:hypothetical protein